MGLIDEVFQLIQGRGSSDKNEAELGRLRLLLSQHKVCDDQAWGRTGRGIASCHATSSVSGVLLRNMN